MSERTIGEEINGQMGNSIGASNEYSNFGVDTVPSSPGMDLSIFKAKTGEGAVSDYLQHPMNFNESTGMAKILRGLTGMFNELDYAVIDIFVGALDLFKSRKGNVNASGNGVTGLS